MHIKHHKFTNWHRCILPAGIAHGKKAVCKVTAVLLMISIFLLHMNVQMVSAAEQKKLPYLIKVNRYHNTITVYEMDEKGEYTVPVKAMVCSVGTDFKTIQGTFKTSAKYRWKLLMGNVYGQYATRIVGGILFHSVYYYENNNPASLATKEYNKLGTAASHGCVRLTVADAKWIYDNCALGTTVIIYDDKKSPGPLGKPTAMKLEKGVGWDPTDPDERNPYLLQGLPTFEGLKNFSVAWGSKPNLKKGIKAYSVRGEDLTSKIEVDGEVNTLIPGKYKVAYSVVDGMGQLKMKVVTVTVKDSEVAPVIEGVSDVYVKNEEELNKELLLEGITVHCQDIPLDPNLIEVELEKVGDNQYNITYVIQLGSKMTIERATAYISM